MERGFGCWELEARSSGSGFGEPPKSTRQRPVLPMAIMAQSRAGRVFWLGWPTWKSACQINVVGQGWAGALGWPR